VIQYSYNIFYVDGLAGDKARLIVAEKQRSKGREYFCNGKENVEKNY